MSASEELKVSLSLLSHSRSGVGTLLSFNGKLRVKNCTTRQKNCTIGCLSINGSAFYPWKGSSFMNRIMVLREDLLAL